MSKSLVLTLGHNSSAIVVENGHILGGYEEERLSGIKSDSAFPMKSIDRLMQRYGQSFNDVCVGHWFTNGVVFNNKYIDLDFIANVAGGRDNVYSIREGLTHHDTHLLSANVFARHHEFPSDYLAVVADGFGTYGECVSIYSVNELGSTLLRRFFGYEKSLGMLYQYATAYLDMKMHNHEYKMLGYEAHIHEVLTGEEIDRLHQIINEDAEDRIRKMLEANIERDTDPVVNKAALAATQQYVTTLLDSVRSRMEKTNFGIYETRVMISYYVQSIVEVVMASLINIYKPANLLVVGGLFYNVKLNHLLADSVDRFCVMPLAGDQGAGLGVYQSVHGDLNWPGHVFWGHRDFNDIHTGSGIIKADENQAFQIISEELNATGFVNVVRGSMEFGPRSLCNTATLAKPTAEVVERINGMNDRTTIMPMAPVMTMQQAQSFLTDVDKVVGSLNYMICTRNVRADRVSEIEGASHAYPLQNRSTCRPQITDDPQLVKLLNEHGPLINTSFNYHGVPIVFDSEDILYSHGMQNKIDSITTVVIDSEI